MSEPKKFWLVPWSTGYECRTKKPEGDSICVVEESVYNDLEKELDKTSECLYAEQNMREEYLNVIDDLRFKSERFAAALELIGMHQSHIPEINSVFEVARRVLKEHGGGNND